MSVRSEFKVGIIVIQSVVALALVIYFLSQFGLRRHGYTVDAAFKDALGIDKGSIVRLAGVQIGTVSEVLLQGSQPVVRLRIQPGIDLFKNYQVSIASGALIGEKYVQITPASPPGDKLEAGSTIFGKDTAQLEEIMGQVSDLIHEFKTTTQSVNKLLKDESIYREIRESLHNITQATAGARDLTFRIQAMVEQNQDEVNSILAQAADAAEDIKAITGEVNRILAKGTVQQDMTEIMASLKSAADKADQITSRLQQTMEMVPGIMEQVHGTAEEARSVVGKVGSVVDDVRKVTADPQVTADMKTTLANVRETSGRLNDITASAQRLLAQAEKMKAIRIMPEGTALTYDFLKATRPQGVRADLNLFIPRDRENFYQIGIFDATETNQLNFQFGRVLSDRFNVRWGLYASKLGIGAGYRVGNRTQLITDIYHPNKPRFDFRVYQGMDENLGLWAGWERLFGSNTFLFGVQVKQ